jgi:glycosyltransferase involved in cell wall biosynthesis
MRILYDHQAFVHPYGGASRYYVEVIDYLKRESDLEIQLPLIYAQNFHLKEKGLHKPFIDKVLKIKYKYSLSFRALQLNQWYLKRKLNQGNFDIFHPTHYDPYFLPYLKGKPYVATVLDMIHELGFVKNTTQAALDEKRISMENATKIVAISQNTKDDLVRLLNIPAEKVVVIYLATDFKPTPKVFTEKKYILFTGNRSNYKNFDRFIEAVAPIVTNKKDLYIRLTGAPLTADEIQKIASLKLTEKVDLEIYVDEKRLMELYSNALCFVFPSLYEGFGIPIVEAFACECPTAISQASCFPEVAGDASLYFDPYSVEDMRQKIQQLIDNELLRKDLIQKGKIRSNYFSWENTAKLHEVLYQNL